MSKRNSFSLTKKKKRKIKRFFFLSFLFIFFVLIIYFLFFSDFFCIDNIVVSGAEKEIKEGVYRFVKSENTNKKLYFFDNNLILLNGDYIKEESLNYFPAIAAIKIEKEYPDTLKIEIEEREEVAQMCFDSCFFLDIEGVAFEELPEKKQSFLEIENQKIEKDINLGEQIISPKLILIIYDFNTKLKALDIKIEKFIIITEERINIVTEEGWKIYFDPQKDIEWQLTKLNVVLNEYLSEKDREQLEYIDLRFGNTAPIKKK
jgi:cell division septal protein FtsQ